MSDEKFEIKDGVVTGLSPGDSVIAGEEIRVFQLSTAGQTVHYKFKLEFRGNELPIELISYQVLPGNDRKEGKLKVFFRGHPYHGYVGGELTRKALQDGVEHTLRYGQVMYQTQGQGVEVRLEYQLDTSGGDPPVAVATHHLSW